MNDHKLKKHILSELERADRMIRATSVILLRVRADIKGLLPIEFVSKNISVYGYSAEELMSRKMSYTDLIHPDDVVPCGEKLLGFLREGKQEYMLEYRIVTADKQVCWVEDRLLIEWDEESGRATHIQGVLLDITDRKEAENALAESLAKAEARTRHLQALNQLSQDLVQATDKPMIFSALRKYTADIVEADRISLTLTSEDETMLDIIELSGDESQAAIMGTQIPIKGSLAGDAYQQKKPIATDNITIKKLNQLGIRSGLCVPIIFVDQVMGTINVGRFNPDQYDEGEVELLVQIASLLASVLANQELVAQTRRTHELIAQGSSVLFQWKPEPDFPVLFVTDNIRQFGYTAEQLISGEVPFLNIVHPEDIDDPEIDFEHYQTHGYGEITETYRIVAPDGKVYWVEDRTTIERNERGEIQYIQGIVQDITERKKLEDELQFANAVVENSLVVLMRWQATDGYPVDFVTKNIAQFGYTAEQITSNAINYADIIHPDDVTQQTAEIANCLAQDDVDNFVQTYRIIAENGQVRWVEDRTMIERDLDGKITYLQGMILDITERKMAEEQLEIANKIIRINPVILIKSQIRNDIAWPTLFVSEGVTQLGYTPNELVSGDVIFLEDIVHPEDKERLIKTVNAHLDAGTNEYMIDYRVLTRDGEVRWMNDLLTCERDEQGRLTYCHEILLDVTDRKLAQNRLEITQHSIDSASNPIVWINENGQFVYVNEAASNKLGFPSREVMLRHHAWDLLPDGSADYWNTYWERIKKEKVFRGEITHVRQDGTTYPAEFTNNYHKVGDHEYVFAFIQDITERKEDEKALETALDAAEAANKAKSEFLSNMSHELRTPLNGILGYTQLLQRDNTVVDTHRQYIDVIHQSGEYLLMLINGVLDIAKIEARKLELNETPIHTYSFFEGISDIVALQLLEKNIEFIVDIAADLPRGIVADHIRLQQVLLNLLGNAIKFTEQGEITLRISLVELEAQTVHILFEVHDTGVGIRPEQLKRIFQAFEQVGDKNARAAGTGLGLAISQQLVKMMGGEIVVSSVMGQGSCFSFSLTFELTADAIATQERRSEYRIGYEGERKTVLVVDDNRINRSFLNNLLTDRGFVIIEAENGREALTQLQADAFDLIITDLVMLEMDGYELSKAVKAHPLIQHIPVIAVSASTEEQSGHSALEAGCDAFLPKPVFVPHLLDEIGNRLQLTWVHEEEKAMSSADESNPAHFLRPTSVNIDALIEIVELGDMLGAITYVNQLADKDQRLTPFSRHVNQLAADFEDDKLLDFLETM